MPRESAIVASIVRVAKRHGWWPWKIHGSPYQIAGMSDLQLLKRGRCIFFEVKQPGKKPTPIQVARMEELEKSAGCPCRVVTSPEEADAELRAIGESLGWAVGD